MEMSIDEAIHDTEVMKEYLEYRDEPCSEGLGVLIDIAHKYQKIQEIVENRNSKPPLVTLNRIIKVVEDGNE